MVFTDRNQSQGGLDNGPFQLDIAGTYRFVVDGVGDDLLSYSFDLVDVPAPNVRPLVFDTVNSGDITIRGAEDQFIITPDFVGQVGFFDLQDVDSLGSFSRTLRTTLFAPDGSVVFDVNSSTTFC